MIDTFMGPIIALPILFSVMFLVAFRLRFNILESIGCGFGLVLLIASFSVPMCYFDTQHSDYFAVDLSEQEICDLSLLPSDTKIRKVEFLQTEEVGGHSITRVVFSYRQIDKKYIKDICRDQSFKLYRELDDLLLDVRDLEYCGRTIGPRDVELLKLELDPEFFKKTR